VELRLDEGAFVPASQVTMNEIRKADLLVAQRSDRKDLWILKNKYGPAPRRVNKNRFDS
jgi:hypothetical protein